VYDWLKEKFTYNTEWEEGCKLSTLVTINFVEVKQTNNA
jgi:hypothetical protein